MNVDGDQAFSGCKALVSMVIPASVTEMGKSVFASCNALEAVEFLGDCPRTGTSSSFASGVDTSAPQELRGCVMDETGRVMGMLAVKVCKATVNGCQTTLTFHGLDGKMVASKASQIMGLSKSPRTFRRMWYAPRIFRRIRKPTLEP